MKLISKIIYFIKHEIWRIPLKSLPKKHSFLIKQLRILLLTIRGFNENKVQLRASALTFYTLLSIVPVAAMAFGIAKGFGFDVKLKQQLYESLSSHQEILNKVIAFSENLLARTKGGYIAGVGFVVLIYSIMNLLSSIESSFNDIWQIKRSRTFIRKITDYLALMLIGPILVVLSSSVTVYITTQLTQIAEEIAIIGYFSPVITILVKLIPYFLIWMLFTLIYIVMPNTKVTFGSALAAGVIAGSIFQVTQWAYIEFQIGVSNYNAIYGSFAAFPLFLFWLQLSWLIVLFGAEISFANQNVEKYEFETESLLISASYKRQLSLLVSHLIIKNFQQGEKALTSKEIAHALEIPMRLVRDIIYELTECHIVSETTTDNTRVMAYQPAQDINRLSIKYIIDVLDEKGVDNIKVKKTKELSRLTEVLGSFKEVVEKSPENKLLKDLTE